MRDLLISEPLILLFVVAGVGFLVGRVRIGDFSLGTSAVLFTGIAASAWDERLQVPEVLSLFGLSLFVYALGVSSGPTFVASFKHKGLRDQIFVVAMAGFALVLTMFIGKAMHFSDATSAGVFSGSLSSTSSLAGVVQSLREHAGRAASQRLLAQPVVAYSVTYPVGVFGMILVLSIAQRMWKADFAKEAKELRHLGASGEEMVVRTVQVTSPEAVGHTVEELRHTYQWRVTFGRYKRLGRISLTDEAMKLDMGDFVMVVGMEEDVQVVANYLGVIVPGDLAEDRSEYDLRRIFVSDSKVAGKHISDLGLISKFGARITRVRRGDVDLLPSSDMRLELGDRVRVIARRSQMDSVSKFFGDSYKALSEIDIAVFSLGLALGVFLGWVPIPLSDDATFRLGYAGGPLLVGLVLGSLRRTGPVVWHLPYSASITLRQLGLIVFLAGVGTHAGHEFVHTLLHRGRTGLMLVAAGGIVTVVTGLVTLIIGHKVFKIPLSYLMGIVAGLQTQAAVATFASEKTRNDIPTLGYASVYAVATVSKIIFAQLLLS